MEIGGSALEIELEYGDDSMEWANFMAIGKIQANKTLNRRGVLGILRTIWSEEVVSNISVVGDNIYGLSFITEKMRDRAVDDGPWSIMGFCMNSKKWDKRDTVEEVDFSEVAFWIQVHNLPMDMLTTKNAAIIGKVLGSIIKVDKPGSQKEEAKGLDGKPLYGPHLRVSFGKSEVGKRERDSGKWQKGKSEEMTLLVVDVGDKLEDGVRGKWQKHGGLGRGNEGQNNGMEVDKPMSRRSPGKGKEKRFVTDTATGRRNKGIVILEITNCSITGVSSSLPSLLPEQPCLELMITQSSPPLNNSSVPTYSTHTLSHPIPNIVPDIHSLAILVLSEILPTSLPIPNTLPIHPFIPQPVVSSSSSSSDDGTPCAELSGGSYIESPCLVIPGRYQINNQVEIGTGDPYEWESNSRSDGINQDLDDVSSDLNNKDMGGMNANADKIGIRDLVQEERVRCKTQVETGKGVAESSLVAELRSLQLKRDADEKWMEEAELKMIKRRRTEMDCIWSKQNWSLMEAKLYPLAIQQVTTFTFGTWRQENGRRIKKKGIRKTKQWSEEVGCSEVPIIDGCSIAVEEIMNKNIGRWELDSIKDWISEHEQKAIKSVPIHEGEESDQIVWPQESSGQYTVKSGYAVYRASHKDDTIRGVSSSHQVSQIVWKEIWKIRAPSKIKVFLWRVCKKALATNEELWKRKCRPVPLCDICGEEIESVEHLLLLCDWTKRVWWQGCFGLKICKERVRTIDQWLLEVFQEISGNSKEGCAGIS
ncbi:hypothetical protein COLO4_07649 [Corchorus olitorius]|uniref:Reverse transcriptase zinc-binding domain-containing protein n=1 Tax=Corchorus olitorius TaxID=93759 RepID=A0A1R3KJ08_9ROSI|nr:hypothetical protein COLO4_07649 [Corchorus olitorius]